MADRCKLSANVSLLIAHISKNILDKQYEQAHACLLYTSSTRSLVTGVKCVRFDLQDTAGSGGNDGGGSDGEMCIRDSPYASIPS